MSKEGKYNSLYMSIALRVADMSHAERLKVGSIIVKDGNIISFGWNGMPAGWDNKCEIVELMPVDNGGWVDPNEIWHQWPGVGKFWIGGVEVERRYRLKTKPEVLHSERNALDKLTRSGGGAAGSTMFCTHAPCIECAKSIYGAGIKKLYYRNQYRDRAGLEFLLRSGVGVEEWNHQ